MAGNCDERKMKNKKEESLITAWLNFHNLMNKLFYICGYKNMWLSELNFSETFVKIYDKILIFGHPALIFLMISYFSTAFKQNNLPPLQTADLTYVIIGLPAVHFNFYTFMYYKAEVRQILHDLFVVLKVNHIDSEVQLRRIKKMKVYIAMISSLPVMGLVQRTIVGIVKTIIYGKVFSPLPLNWPDEDDQSAVGYLVRALHYLLSCFYLTRLNGVNAIILLLLLSYSHQFEDLQSYFQNLEKIFKNKNLSQMEKEKRYEDEFKNGVRAHALTLRCLRRCQRVCRMVFSVQLLQLYGCLITIMIPIIATTNNLLKLCCGVNSLSILANLAVLMCSSGNITIEAERVADAMYASGWQNCYGASSVRVRKLVFIGMVNAQQPLVLTAFGFMEMSYQNFVTVVKTSYSVFSIFF